MPDYPRIEELRRRVQQDPASIAFAALADEYRRAGRFQEAVETCRAGLLRHPAYLFARVTLGRALLEIGEFDEAQAQLEQVLRSAPENLAAIRALADIHRRRGDAHEAPAPDLPLAKAGDAADTVSAAPAPPAPLPVAVLPPPAAPPPPDPAIQALEQFLAAIQRARRDLESPGAARS